MPKLEPKGKPMKDNAPTVVVTGFGLFANYKLNSSWESVKRLKLDGVNLIIEEIAVAYDEVDKRVQQIWTQHKPSLVIHCGVSSLAKCITIETRAAAQKHLFTKPDIYGKLPKCDSTDRREDKCDNCLECCINLDKVCHNVNQHFKKGSITMGAELSSNAGRFLCEYIFHSSLSRDKEKAAFIHVPDISDNCPLEEIAAALQVTIEVLVNEVFGSNKTENHL